MLSFWFPSHGPNSSGHRRAQRDPRPLSRPCRAPQQLPVCGDKTAPARTATAASVCSRLCHHCRLGSLPSTSFSPLEVSEIPNSQSSFSIFSMYVGVLQRFVARKGSAPPTPSRKKKMKMMPVLECKENLTHVNNEKNSADTEAQQHRPQFIGSPCAALLRLYGQAKKATRRVCA